ncbi:MAG: queuosine salvage family protein [Chloroflexota bacterium]|nr:queuosine salvage family protein [Chloroflexota bacterium]
MPSSTDASAAAADPLGVLGTTRRVADRARLVRIDDAAVARLAARLVAREVEPPTWRVWPHWRGDVEPTSNYVLVLDALNFSFWGDPKWRVSYDGRTVDGYWALAAALRRTIEEGVPILDPAALAEIDEATVRHVFRGESEIPLLDGRIANLREVGRGLLGAGGPFSTVVARARHSAAQLVREIVGCFPSFDDVASYDGEPVRFYKRAQILVSDLYGAFDGRGIGRLDDLDTLTAFADYKIPQILRAEGVLVYEPELAERVDRLVEIPPGDPAEVEIRAATIWGCELLRRALVEQGGRPLRAFEVDWLLWTLAQERAFAQPYHRTRTIFY